MADKQRTCVVYAAGLENAGHQVARELEAQKHEVCIHGGSEEEVDAARPSTSMFSKELKDCLAGASLCVLVINAKSQFDALAAHAAALGIRVVVVMVGDEAMLSGAADEVAASCVTIASKKLKEALDGEEVWEEPSGAPKQPRNVHRQKCQ